jgi:hypothetical protein
LNSTVLLFEIFKDFRIFSYSDSKAEFGSGQLPVHAITYPEYTTMQNKPEEEKGQQYQKATS